MSESDSRAEVDPSAFRKVMGNFATGVTVITAETDETPRGMTANAFMSGSLDPPLCLVSVAKRAHMHGLLGKVAGFGVNVLAYSQEHYATHFAGRPIVGLDVPFATAGGIPVLADAVARIATHRWAEHDCGDHTLFVGRIVFMDCDERPPLVYHRGGFGGLVRLRDREEVPVPEFW